MTLETNNKVLVIVGPTGVGKTQVAISIGQELGSTIVNADSRQVYRYMDVGTAKPTETEISSVPHQLIDIVDPDEEYNLAIFLQDSQRALGKLLEDSNARPMVVGGTGQYIWGLLENWQVPNVSPDLLLRQKLEQLINDKGLATVAEQLNTIAPQLAASIDLSNPRRVIRAMEIAKSGSMANRVPPIANTSPYDYKIIGLTMPRQTLFSYIDQRVEVMIENNWLGEVSSLLTRGYDVSLPSMSGIGYRELVEHLDNKLSLDEAVARIKTRTHRFVRTQYNWFKPKDPRIHWIDMTEAQSLDTAQNVVHSWINN